MQVARIKWSIQIMYQWIFYPMRIFLFQIPMSWTLRKMAQYVAQSKYLQQLKENDDICRQAIEKANFLLFCKGKPLLTDTPKFSILWKSYQGSNIYSVWRFKDDFGS